jgi:translation initiation factor 2 alpha subunit (eIF-2alpha)|tara:strand:+ start:58 stop:345 length:288 start_codon:yes stop_codon:yes gene_type:complete
MSTIIKTIENRKSVHFNIRQSAHSALRIACFKSNITMQEFFDEISQRVEAESADVMTIISDLSERKRSNQIEKISQSDTDTVYNIIENASVFGEK